MFFFGRVLLMMLLQDALCLLRTLENNMTEIPIFTPGSTQIDDPEPSTEKMADVSALRANETTPGMGLLFAGKAEFNWIVEVREETKDEDLWSTGNLITFFHVITTCRALAYLVPFNGAKANRIELKGSVNVYFAQFYLFEPEDDKVSLKYKAASGKRIGNILKPHPGWNPAYLTDDFGLIEMSTGISPYSPLRGYMPVVDPDAATPPDYNPIKQHKVVCHIVTFGKQYINVNRPKIVNTPGSQIIQDYKIKFRVYYMDSDKCSKYLGDTCEPHRPACNQGAYDLAKQKLMCFIPRKRVGSICDHHRGAPLVCNGFVYGLVTQGVPLNKCHSLLQYPVFVLQVFDYTKELYQQLAAGTLHQQEERSKSFANSQPCTSMFFLVTMVSLQLVLLTSV